MAENKYVEDPKRMPVYMSVNGTGGDIIWFNAGSATNVANTYTFAGVLDTTTVAGSYGVVHTEGLFTFLKGNTGVKFEQGQDVYGSNATTVASAKVTNGSVIGLAYEQSAATNGSVIVYVKGMNSLLM